MTAPTTEDDYDGLDFSQSVGIGAQSDLVAEQKRKRGGDFLQRFQIKDGETVDFRFITDMFPNDANRQSWVTLPVHRLAPIKPVPADHKGGRPSIVTLACRKGKIFVRRYGGACYGCDVLHDSPRMATFALVAIREEVFWTDEDIAALPAGLLRDKLRPGMRKGLKDAVDVIEKVDEAGKKTGESYTAKRVAIFNLPISVFEQYANMGAMWGGLGGTVVDRDVRVKRTGSTKEDTRYSVSAFDPCMCLIPVDPAQPDGPKKEVPYDLRVPEVMAARFPNLPDLYKHVEVELGGDRQWQRFFLPNGEGDTATPRTEAPNDAMAALGARVATHADAARGVAPASPPTPPVDKDALAARMMGMADVVVPPAEVSPTAPAPVFSAVD